jgi:hypothetical protein
MKKLMIASACIFVLSMGAAFAQAAGTSSEGKAESGTTHSTKHMKKGTTTGMGSGSAHHGKSSKSMSAHPSGSGGADSGAPSKY